MHPDDPHQGLLEDLPLLLRPHRRQVLGWFAAALMLPAAACGDDKDSDTSGGAADDSSGDSSPDSSDGTDSWTETCTTIPEETAGPYPGDGSNGPNALTLDDVVRSDIRSSIGDLSGTAEGVLLTVKMRLVSASDGCTPLAGYAIYIWHCDRDGDYSMYTNTTQNYLRGVQVTDSDGVVTFTTIFPGCYSGRWPHIHFEVYPSVDAISSSRQNVATSQLALPEEACDQVYAEAGYETSVSNLASLSLESDNVFSDGAEDQLAEVTGDVTSGFVATLQVGISA